MINFVLVISVSSQNNIRFMPLLLLSEYKYKVNKNKNDIDGKLHRFRRMYSNLSSEILIEGDTWVLNTTYEYPAIIDIQLT